MDNMKLFHKKENEFLFILYDWIKKGKKEKKEKKEKYEKKEKMKNSDNHKVKQEKFLVNLKKLKYIFFIKFAFKI